MPKHFSRTTSRTKTLWQMHSLRPRPVFRMKSSHPRFKNISSNSNYSFDNPLFMLLKPNLNQLFSHHLQHKSTLFKHQHKTHQPTFSWFVHHHHPPTNMVKSLSSSTQTSGKNIKPPSQTASTAIASTATASPEAADQQHKRARRILAHPSDPLTPSPPEIVSVQPERCAASEPLRTTTTAAEDSNGTPKEFLAFNHRSNLNSSSS